MIIVGDRKYGSQRPMDGAIALHAFQVAFDHPVSKERITLVSPEPRAWRKIMK
jgi:23S rRNA pseudouridine1911/1915/1917 synthase